ncbi:hypothetical protein [Falsibacillus pallidus]|uniref:hypothetical protein n=1 Tax=Falsibacillus pallidus TaxID=493781 RepID=UPI003D98FC78
MKPALFSWIWPLAHKNVVLAHRRYLAAHKILFSRIGREKSRKDVAFWRKGLAERTFQDDFLLHFRHFFFFFVFNGSPTP